MPAGEPLRGAATRLRQQAAALVPALRPVVTSSGHREWRGRAGDDFRSELSFRVRRLEHLAGQLEAASARLRVAADRRDEAEHRAPAGAR